MLKNTLQKISQEFTPALQHEYVGHPLADFIRNEGPNIILDNLPESHKDYLTKGSCGQDKWATKRGAWINIMNPAITRGASKGYYLVYGFPAGTTEFVFGLSQGYTEAREMYGSKWEDAVENTANLMRLCVPGSLAKGFLFGKPRFEFQFDTSDKGYRVGYALHKIYDSANLPEEEVLISDLHRMLEIYDTVFKKNGETLYRLENNTTNLTLEKPYEVDEEDYQRANKSLRSKNKRILIPKSAKLTTKEKNALASLRPKTKARPRNSEYAEIARLTANFKCEIDTHHLTFKRKTDNKEYTEAHHLIPYSEYDEFAELDISIDRPINIVSLCPNCHRNIHYGTEESIRYLVKTLYEQRKDDMLKIYNCSLERLYKFYNV